MRFRGRARPQPRLRHLPVTVLMSFGLMPAFVNLTLLATSGAKPEDHGLVSGIVNTTGQLGGALGLAVAVAAGRTASLAAAGTVSAAEALISSYRFALGTGAVFVAVALGLGLKGLKKRDLTAFSKVKRIPTSEKMAPARNSLVRARPHTYISGNLIPGVPMQAWWIYALLSAIFASLTAILAKIGIKGVDSDVATALRTAVILVFAWGIVFFRGRAAEVTSLSRHSLIFIVLSGFATGLSWLFYFRALQTGKVSLVAPIDKASLALTILLAVVFLGETLTIKTAAGGALILAGTLVLIL